MDVPGPSRTHSVRRSLVVLDVLGREPEPGAVVCGVVGHQVDGVCSPADGVGARAGCRVVEVAQAGGDAFEEAAVAGVQSRRVAAIDWLWVRLVGSFGSS